ncbi:hypothetical protein [Candidatus Solirubrobacter pratensis]|uniref:hypothetical protein n=1 Tax=Candidatus Solirubrobacter pratensis TaxID=1298857 RepID=UPI00040C0B6C|nr:hypothetical protein [Candidatus Solirubrobacter pratensis]
MPGREAIQTLTELGPLVELGAGEGYWARILLNHGATVDAFDIEPVGVPGIEVIDRYPGRPRVRLLALPARLHARAARPRTRPHDRTDHRRHR